MTTEELNDQCTAILDSISDSKIVLAIQRTDYRLEFSLTTPPDAVQTQPGKRIKGVIQGKALRMHHANAGGCFIEPIYGAPRIVAGNVVAVDQQRQRLLCDIVVPMWIEIAPGQTASDFSPGQMVNFYVESGMRFTPADPVADAGHQQKNFEGSAMGS